MRAANESLEMGLLHKGCTSMCQQILGARLPQLSVEAMKI